MSSAATAAVRRSGDWKMPVAWLAGDRMIAGGQSLVQERRHNGSRHATSVRSGIIIFADMTVVHLD